MKTFPSNCVSVVLPFLDIEDFIIVRHSLRESQGGKYEEEMLSYPNKVVVFPYNNYYFRIGLHEELMSGKQEAKRCPKIMISGFSRVVIADSMMQCWDWMQFVVIPNIKHLTYLDFSMGTIQIPRGDTKTMKERKVILSKLKYLRVTSWRDLKQFSDLACPAIEDVLIRSPSEDDISTQREQIFVVKHAQLIQRLSISVDWWNEGSPGLPLFHSCKNLRELVIFNICFWRCGRWQNKVECSERKESMSEKEFFDLPTSISFPLHKEQYPKLVEISDGWRPVDLEGPLKKLRQETGLPYFKFITDPTAPLKPVLRLIYKDGRAIQLGLKDY